MLAFSYPWYAGCTYKLSGALDIAALLGIFSPKSSISRGGEDNFAPQKINSCAYTKVYTVFTHSIHGFEMMPRLFFAVNGCSFTLCNLVVFKIVYFACSLPGVKKPLGKYGPVNIEDTTDSASKESNDDDDIDLFGSDDEEVNCQELVIYNTCVLQI